MDKLDRDFIKKIAKKADRAYSVAEKTLALIESKQVIETQLVEPGVISQPQSTQTHVVFKNDAERSKYSPQMVKLNQDVDAICKRLGIKELVITFKKP